MTRCNCGKYIDLRTHAGKLHHAECGLLVCEDCHKESQTKPITTTQDLITQLNTLADLQIKHKGDLGGTWLAGRYLGRDKWEKNLLNAPFREAAEALKNATEDNEKLGRKILDMFKERDELKKEGDWIREQWHKDIAERDQLRAEVEKLKGDIRCMVEKAADKCLDGYRELGEKAANAENMRDDLKRERDQLRAELAEKGDKLQRALGDLESLPWASSKELGAEIKHLRADIEQMELDNDRLTLKVMELVNQRDSLQATISNLETGMGLRIAAAEAQLATRTEVILPCPKCGSVPIYWYTGIRERNYWGCKKGCVYGPENDPTGAGWNAMVRNLKENGK